ncbi:hypothetical protein IAD21_00646 [Abditibacteriota bacterium]|nr:hypothetical protein IAD21_00646 [Abditibacteriota bacterium]
MFPVSHLFLVPTSGLILALFLSLSTLRAAFSRQCLVRPMAHRARGLVGALLVLLVSATIPQTGHAQTITTTTVDAGVAPGSVGYYTSQAIINGKPAISYWDQTNSDLKFVINSAADGSGTWNTTTVDSAGSVGFYTSLALVNGKPAISYLDATNQDLKFAINSAADGTGSWTTTTVDSAGVVGYYTSLAVVNGKPAISYSDNTNQDLKFAINSAADGSGTWTKITVDSTGSVGTYTSLALVNGKPAISYYDFTNFDLKFVINSAADGSGTWTTTTVDSAGDVGQYTSLALVGGKPAISYFDGTNTDLKFAINSAADGTGSWTTTTVDSTGSVGFYTSLAIINGKPAISYYDQTNQDLKFAINSAADGSGSWTKTTVDSAGNVGQYTSLALVGGKPAISYFDGTNTDLKFAINSAADGTGSWTTTTADASVGPATVGQYTSQAIINGKPAISYFDGTNTDLKFAINSAADGTGSWTTTTVDSTGSVGFYTSLAIINGKPAISYYDQTNQDLKFAINSAADGSGSWTKTTVDSAGNVGQYTSLALVGGKPAISYYDGDNSDLKFAINSAADGSGTWNTTTVDSAGFVGTYTSLALVNGKPAISYWDQTNADLKFAINSAADGSGTWSLTTVDSAGFVGFYTSLAVVNGKPAISYYDGDNADLKFAINSAADGSGTWTKTTVDSAGDVGTYTSLVLVNGKPAISYYDGTNFDLKFAINSAADGSGSWSKTTVDSAGVVGQYTSLAVVAGQPAISYYDQTNGDLKWARITLASAPVVTTGAATALTVSSATLNGTVNPGGDTTTAQFQYGLTTSYGSTAPVTLSPNDGTTAQNVSATVNALAPHTTYHYRLSATNNQGTTNGSDATFTTLNSTPTISSVTITPSNPTTNSTLTANPTATDADAGDTLTYTYQWFKNSSPITDETNKTLDLSKMDNGDKGDKISVTVTANDGIADSTSVTSDPVTVLNTAPVIGTVTITPTAPLTSDDLTAHATSHDDDDDPVTYSYVWKKGTTVIVGQNGATLPASQTEDGDSITVTVTPNDGTVDGSAVTSDPVVVGNRIPTVDSVDPQGASNKVGDKRTFTLTMSDANGARDIKEMWLLINTTLDWGGGATLIYRPSASDPTTGQLFLRRGDEFLPPITVGTGASSTDVLDNGAVRVVATDIAITSVGGNGLTLALPLTIRDGLVGQNTLFARVQDGDGATDASALAGEFGFVRRGSYTVTSQFSGGGTNSPPTLSKLTPGATYTTLNASGIAPAAQTFGFFAQDNDGIGDIESVWFLAGPVRSWAHSATFVYYPRTRRLVLRSDDGNSFLGGGQVGQPGIIENSQVKVDLSKVKVTVIDGKSFGLTLPLQAKTGLLGKNSIWLRVQDNTGATSPGGDDLGFVRKGNWDIKKVEGTGADPKPSNGDS